MDDLTRKKIHWWKNYIWTSITNRFKEDIVRRKAFIYAFCDRCKKDVWVDVFEQKIVPYPLCICLVCGSEWSVVWTKDTEHLYSGDKWLRSKTKRTTDDWLPPDEEYEYFIRKRVIV